MLKDNCIMVITELMFVLLLEDIIRCYMIATL
jgi:hypothetical protein